MMKWSVVLAGVLAAAASTPLVAQTVETHPEVQRGEHSIALDVSNDLEIGYWNRQSERMDLGLQVWAQGVWSDANDRLAIGITPAIKQYFGSAGRLAPYSYWGIPLGYTRVAYDNTGVEDTNEDSFSVGGELGFGLDWFPVPQVSVGGHVGLMAAYSGIASDENTFLLLTQSSGIRVHLYF
jgi:hypothetical protein